MQKHLTTHTQNRISVLAAILAILFTMASCPTCAFATTGTKTEVINTVAAGDISISLEEYVLDEHGEKKPFIQGQAVLPGQAVPKIVGITNLANDCWLRVRPDFAGELLLDETALTITDTGWEKHGDYYYLKTPLKTGESVTFITDVKVPADITPEDSGKLMSLSVTADAVQEAHFTPDFTSDDPWFGTVIEKCVHGDHTAAEAADERYSVVFKGGAEGLVRIGDDFFSNWGEIMPGDTMNGTAEIRNDYIRTVRVFMYTEDMNEEERLLAEALTLTIRSGDEVIYEGDLTGVMDPVLLGVFAKGDGTTLTYTLTAPAELDNRYALTAAKTKWVFTAEIPTPVTLFVGGEGRSVIYLSGIAMLIAFAAVSLKRKGGKPNA